MYVVLLMMFAFLLPLLRVPVILLGISLTGYVVARAFGWNLPSWTDGGWYFNPLCWQLLFVIGAVMSRHRLWLPVPARILDVGAGITIAGGLLLVWLVWPSDDVSARVPRVLARMLLLVDKEGMHPMRLLSILALTWAAIRLVPFSARWLRSAWAAPWVLCGQHSLPVFCSGIALSFLGRLVMEEQGGWIGQAAVNIAGPLALVAVAALAAWYKSKGRRSLTEAAARDAVRPTSPGLPVISRAGNV